MSPDVANTPPTWRRLLRAQAQVLAMPPGAGACPSPCQSICQMHAVSGWCEGCLRSIDEIAAWSRMDEAAKQAVWAQLPDRMHHLIRLERPA